MSAGWACVCFARSRPLLPHAGGEPILLHTHLIVREDDLSLVGFGSEEELGLFEKLISVSGVGPRLGLAALSAMAPDALRLAISQEQPDLLARVPGIGKKTAQKIVLELKDKIGPVEVTEGLAALTEADAAVIDALTALGYSMVEAQRAVQALPRSHRYGRPVAPRPDLVQPYMIAVPPAILASLARAFGTTAEVLTHIGGGREDSDGVVYAYPYAEGRRLLKVMAFRVRGATAGSVLSRRAAPLRQVPRRP